ASALGAKRRRAIHVLSLIGVPVSLPLDGAIPEAESAAQSKIEQAKLICGQRVSGKVQRVRPGQAGQRTGDEADRTHPAATAVPLRYRNGSPLYGKTLQPVLAKRPTRVLVAAHPDTAAVEYPAPEPVA